MQAHYGCYNFFQQSSLQLVKCRAAHQMTQYNCCGKNKCSLRYWSLYLGDFNVEKREEYLFILSGSVCHSGSLKTFSLSVCFFTSPPTSYFLMLCFLTFFSPPKQLSLFSTQVQKAEQQFYKQNKQSTHPIDTVLLKKKAWPDLRFTGVAICMLRPINFSWL